MDKNQLISDRERMIENLFSQYADSVLRMCFLYLNDAQLAEDALQETFIKAYRSSHTFRGEASPKTWLIRIAVNTCKNMKRCRRDVLSIENTDIGERLPAREEDAAERMSVCAEISRLPEKYREVILLYYYQELDMRTIASVLHIPQTTVAYRLRQGKALLKPGLKEMYLNE